MSSCKSSYGTRKIGHMTRQEAESHLVIAESKHRHVHKFTVYRCYRCHLWHIGRIPLTSKLKKKRRYEDAVDEVLVGRLIQALKNILNTTH